MVIELGVTGLKKTGFLYFLGFLGEMWEKWWCDFVCVERFGLMIGLLLVLSIHGVTIPILGNGFGI